MQTRWASLTALAVVLVPAICVAQELPSERVVGKLEVVATFNGPMPKGHLLRAGGPRGTSCPEIS
jgi:hypothetical protein